jgi:hypothetical protein
MKLELVSHKTAMTTKRATFSTLSQSKIKSWSRMFGIHVGEIKWLMGSAF